MSNLKYVDWLVVEDHYAQHSGMECHEVNDSEKCRNCIKHRECNAQKHKRQLVTWGEPYYD